MKKNKTSGKRNNALKAARYGLLVALALVLSYAEAQLPAYALLGDHAGGADGNVQNCRR